MNDRYLYRAKHIHALSENERLNGLWIVGYLSGEHHISNIDGEYLIDPSTISQCSGLKDKNGKLIWENDIMVAHLDDSFPEDTTYARVVWNNNGFYMKEQGSEDILPLDKFEQEYFEVCGNLFDNPELLEVGE